jgi:uncharacterized protein
LLKACDINRTLLQRGAFFEAGQRTGKFRLGTDQLITDDAGNWGHISFEDYAVALVDELERPAHEQARFTAAY